MNKITLKLVRSFSFGFTIFSPKLNGFCVEISMACFSVHIWNRGKGLLGVQNFWGA